jgi:PKD repeat protein
MKNFGFLGSVMMKALGVLAAAVLLAALPAAATAQDGQFILHPGYINGTVTIPDGLGGTHSIASMRAVANGIDPVTNTPYTAMATSNNSSQFHLIVEGGAWYYTIAITAYYGSYPYGEYCQVNWSRRVTVSPDQTVNVEAHTDAIIIVSYSVAGETVTQMWPTAYVTGGVSSTSPQYQFSSQARCNGGQYRLPVVGGSGVYQVYSGSTRLTKPDDYINLGYKQMTVAPGQEAVAAFSTVPGYVEGRITLLGGTLYRESTSVGSTFYDPQTHQNYSASTRPLSDGTFRFPAPPGGNSEFYGHVSYDYGTGTHALVKKYGDVVAGGTSTVTWTVDLNSGICGDIAVTGINLDGISIYGYGPNGSYRSETLYSPGEYRLDSLVSGSWGIKVYVWDYEYDQQYGMTDYDYYYFPTEIVEIPPGGQSVVDFTLDPGFISGAILAGNSAAIPDLYYTRVYAYPTDYYYPPYTEEHAYTYQYDTNPQDDHNINIYDLFVAPGDWRVDGSSMTFRHLYQELGYTNEAWLQITERVPNSNPYEFNMPVLNVSSGQTSQLNLGYQTAKITARLRVATGAPLSKPRVSGSYIRSLENVLDKYASLNGSSTASNVQEGRVELYAIPGTYRLTAEATVAGTSTTFGIPFQVTVQAGDVVVTDPDAPNVVIDNPPGNFETYDSCVEVTGTVTDENGITTFTIDGVPVGIGPDGSFGTIICDLVLGPNTITINACDEYGNCVTIDRTVFLLNHAPEVIIGGPYGVVEGIPIIFSAANSYDLDNDPLQFRWDFNGDGVWDTEYSSNPEASYMWPDDYHGNVIVQVNDGHNEVRASTVVVVADADPVIDPASLPGGAIRIGDRIELTASFTDQGLLDTHTATISWGDGTSSNYPVTEAGGSGTVSGSHVYAAPGIFPVMVTVTDDDGGFDTEMFTVVLNNPPLATIGGPYEAVEGTAITFSAGGSSDPDGDPLLFRWDFDRDGIWDTDYSDSPAAIHTWTDDFSGGAVVEVFDGFSAATASTTVRVTDAGPVIDAIIGPTETIIIGEAANLSAGFTDLGIQDTHTALFNWGDGTRSDGSVTESGGSGTVTGSHAFTAPGEYHVTLTVWDDDGQRDIKDYVIIVNSPPSAVIGGPYAGEEGSAITLSAAGSSDPDNDPLQYRWDFNGDGSWDTDYSASSEIAHIWADDFSGTVAVEVFDGHTTSTASTTVAVSGVPPMIISITGPTQTIRVGATADLSASFTDPGTMDTHAAAIDWGDGTPTGWPVTPTEGGGTVEGSHTFTAPGQYHVILTVTDDEGLSDTKEIIVTVNNPPVATIGGPYSGTEGSAITLSAAGSSDADGDPLQYRWDFENDGTWETPYSASAETTHTWPDDYSGTVTVEVFDGYAATTASTTMTVAGVEPAIGTITGPVDKILAGATADLSASFTDPGTEDTHTAAYDWGDGTTTAGAITEAGGAGTAEGSHAFTAPGEYHVAVTVTDDDGKSATKEYVVTVDAPPVAAIAPTSSGVEGSAVTFSAAGSSDPDGDPLQYRWDFDNDGIWDTGYSSSAVAAHTWADDYSGNVVVEVYDGYATTTASTALTVANAKPTITSISGPTGPLPLGSGVSLIGNFTDPGTVDTHTATFAWGDGTSSNGTINESGGSGTAAGSHVYTTPGVYRVTLTVTDDDGGSDTEEFLFAVIFDPTGSFVTGGGAIDSPLGAYALNPALTGKASFGFVSKYLKGATVPTGNTQFQFQAGDLSFHSIAYEWLVISGARAQYKGTGMINGTGVYGFMLTAIDGQVNGGGGVDRFRFKIWDIGTGAIIYDNQMGTPDDGAVVTALTQGSITIHK